MSTNINVLIIVYHTNMNSGMDRYMTEAVGAYSLEKWIISSDILIYFS